jgi:hypothetical protein
VTGTRADQYAVTWASVNPSLHWSHGGWRHIQGEPVCNCGVTLAAPEGEAA